MYDEVFEQCFALFKAKMKDYGPSWTLFRPMSLADQLWIKIKRVRTLEENGEAAVPEGREPEFMGIINYSIMMLMKIKLNLPDLLENEDVDYAGIFEEYKQISAETRELMERKNQDYGAAWKEMHPFSITDQILTKIYRVKSILNNDGKLLVSENIDAQLMDIMNYCIFALIRANK